MGAGASGIGVGLSCGVLVFKQRPAGTGPTVAGASGIGVGFCCGVLVFKQRPAGTGPTVAGAGKTSHCNSNH